MHRHDVKLKLLIRGHMTDHVIWSRSYMVSILANLPDTVDVKNRLFKNQDAIGNCLREFFGDIVIENLIILRKEYCNLFVDLLDAIKNGDSYKLSNIEGDLVTNIENISILLSIANPLFTKEELIDMLNTQLILAKYEFIARMSGDYQADILYFDMSMHHAIMLSDYISNGLIQRFFNMGISQQQEEQDVEYISVNSENIIDNISTDDISKNDNIVQNENGDQINQII